MIWLVIAIIAYLLNAIAAVVDKFLLTKSIPQPVVYAFFISALGILALVLIPFGFTVPVASQIVVSLLAGLTFTYALLYLFKALKCNDTSRITPFIGGLSPVFILLLSFAFLGERLGHNEIFAFLALVLGTILITLDLGKKKTGQGGFWLATFSAALFAVSYVLTKEVYNNQEFISGFIWTRIGAFIGALMLLLPKANREAIRVNLKKPKTQQKKTGGIFIFGQAAGALSYLLVNYAISLASVSLINAMQGLQYVFLLFLVFFLSKFHPAVLKEKLTRRIIIQKVSAIVLVGLGLALIAFN